MARRRWRRLWWAALIVAGLVVAAVGRPAFHVTRAAWRDRDDAPSPPPGEVDDVSRREHARPAEVWHVPDDPAAAVEQLRAVLARAKAAGLPVSVAGARHSMGGHTVAPGGVVIDTLGFRRMSLDGDVLTVGAGARWADVLPYLDARGRSVEVMQSNDSFTVGGSLSVNCHGWQVGRPPFVSSVESFRLMTADGLVRTCSRAENSELFALAAGGYGLFGIVLDARLRVVPNARYRAERAVFPADRYEAEYADRVERTDAAMAFGRLCVTPGEGTFLREAILTSFHPDPLPDGAVPPLAPVAGSGLARAVLRGSIGSEYGKALRWDAEKHAGTAVFGRWFTRNQLLHTGVERFQERSADRVDVLDESFVPRGQVAAFLERMRTILPRHDVDLLNVTVRAVGRDDQTVLRYAPSEGFAFVFLFNQPLTPEADATLAAATREVIDATLDLGGSYYLPYRPHATPAQFRRAYPSADRFFAAKARYDPDGRFQNGFSRRYGPTQPGAGGR
jgi:FAD/FMN-containing dehydrogenase